MTSGVYSITNQINGHKYIGSSFEIENRWARHGRLLQKNNHHSRHLQHAWNKYGADNLLFSMLLVCDPCNLILFEQICIDFYKPEYNVCPVAGNSAGVIRSAEYRRKQSVSQSGKVLSLESREKISKGMIGKRNSLGTTRTVSQETREKIRLANIGKVVSEEVRRKISEKNKLYRHTEEAKSKIGLASKGNKYASRKQTQEEINKRSASLKSYWENKRNNATS